MDEAFIKKVQPNSPEAEQSVIGAMIMDRDAIADVIDIVNADDFYQKQNGILFEAMTELYREGKPVDLVTLQNKLKKKDVPESMKSLEFNQGSSGSCSNVSQCQTIRNDRQGKGNTS